MDGLQPLAVGLPLGVNLDVGDQRLHQVVLFRVVHHVVQTLEVGKDADDVLPRYLIGFDGLLLGSGLNQQLLRVVDLIIHLIESVIEVGFAVLIVAVVRVELVDLLHQLVLDGVLLPELLFQMRDLLLQGGGVDLGVDLLRHQSGEVGTADEGDDHLGHSLIHEREGNLRLEGTLVAPVQTAVLAAVVVELLVVGAVLALLDALADVHARAAFRAFDQPGEQVGVLAVAAVIALVPLSLRAEPDLCVLPILNGDERLMDAVAQQIVVVPDDAVVIARAMNLLRLSAPIGDLAAVGGVLDDLANISRAEQLAPGVPMVQLQDAVTLQILRDEPTAHFLVNIQVEDQPDGLGLFLVDD